MNDTYERSYIWSVTRAEAPERVSSAWIDEQLADTYARTGVRPGLLEGLAGIVERRWWPEAVTFDEAAALAGAAAIADAGIAPDDVDMLISTSVCKHHLEPSVACAVHARLGLAPTCVNFDLGNACLGFVNAMHLGAMAIDAGRARNILIVDGEGSRQIQEPTLARLRRSSTSAEDVFDEFATLTLGSGAAAMVMGGPRNGAHRFVGGTSRAATEHHGLCVGDLNRMRTDTAGLLASGLELAQESFKASVAEGWDWEHCDRYVMHQVSAVHTAKMCELLHIPPEKVPLTYPMFGNMGPAALAFTLSTVADELAEGERVLLMGIGSGLNCSGAEIIW
jgi:3-oxoacyl-[acyl-carrier-protein] synthase-3